MANSAELFERLEDLIEGMGVEGSQVLHLFADYFGTQLFTEEFIEFCEEEI